MRKMRCILALLAAMLGSSAAYAQQARQVANVGLVSLHSEKMAGHVDLTEALFAGMKKDGAEALVVQPFFTGHAAEISTFGLAVGLPVVADYPEFARAGALASVGVNLGAQVRRTVYFIDRILQGAKPADFPVEQPTKFELVVNVNTAKKLGLRLSPMLLARVDEVIE